MLQYSSIFEILLMLLGQNKSIFQGELLHFPSFGADVFWNGRGGISNGDRRLPEVAGAAHPRGLVQHGDCAHRTLGPSTYWLCQSFAATVN